MDVAVADEMDKNNNYTLFIDLDGTLIKHNYYPETVKDVLISDVYEGMLDWKKQGAMIIATTARTPEHVTCMLHALPELKDLIDIFVYNLPTGPRMIINDVEVIDGKWSPKAMAFNVERDKGVLL